MRLRRCRHGTDQPARVHHDRGRRCHRGRRARRGGRGGLRPGAGRGRPGADHAARQRPRCARCRSCRSTTLLEALREHLGLAGTKPGCERGECGACTVLIDGETRYACLMLALEAEGHEVTTIEGLAKGEELSDVQKAFVDEDAMQCGYCTPGQVMAVEGLLRHETQPVARRDPGGRERQPLPLRRLRPHLQGRAARRRSAPQRGEVSHDRHARSPLDRDEGRRHAPSRASTPTSASAAPPSTPATSCCPTCSTPPSSAAPTPTRG